MGQPEEKPGEFESIARQSQADSESLWREYWDFIRTNKKWWMIPILVVLAVFGILVFLAGTGMAPFIYTMW